jgi:hypothetical protein
LEDDVLKELLGTEMEAEENDSLVLRRIFSKLTAVQSEVKQLRKGIIVFLILSLKVLDICEYRSYFITSSHWRPKC